MPLPDRSAPDCFQADSKLANLHQGLKGGGEIYVGSEFSCAIRGLNHIARQKLISVVSKTKTKRCVATSATAAFNNCIEVRSECWMHFCDSLFHTDAKDVAGGEQREVRRNKKRAPSMGGARVVLSVAFG